MAQDHDDGSAGRGPARRGARRPDESFDGDEDSLEAIVARAMLDDEPPPARPSAQSETKAGPAPDAPRRRIVAGAEAVDQILNAGAPAGARASGATTPAAPKEPAPKAVAPRAPAPRAPAPKAAAKPAEPEEPAPRAARIQARPTPKPPARPGGSGAKRPPARTDDRPRRGPGLEAAPEPPAPPRAPAPEPDAPFDFEIPAAPRSDADARELLSGGEAMDLSPRETAARRGALGGGAEPAEPSDALDGPGWDSSPFDPTADAAGAPGRPDGPAYGPAYGAGDDAADGASEAAPERSAPAAAPKGADRGDGDLLDPREAEGAGDPHAPPRDDPSAGRGQRDLLSEESLKAYLEELSVGAARGPAPPEAGADAAAPHEGAEPEEAPEDGDRRDGGERRSAPRDEGGDRRGDAPRSWSIKPSPGTKDDPLLGSLTILCTLLDRNISAEGLTAGLPLVDGMLTPELFVRAAGRAGISARLVRRELDSIGKLALPCVLLLDGQRACVLTKLKRTEGKATIILPEMGAGARDVDYKELAQDYVGYALFARPEFQYDQRAEETRVADPKGWFWGTVFGSWKLYIEVIIAAIMINAFVIANPLFVMNVYDRVVPNFAEETLWVLAIGILVVYAFDFLLKLLRAYLVDVAGKTADTQIAGRLFQQMLGMKMAHRPPSAGALANQLREFEHLREFFTSSTMTTLIDLPFIFLFLAIISVIGTWTIVVIPTFIVFLTVIVGLLMQIPMQRVVRETQRESQQKNAILIEAISGVETIKATGSEGRMQRAWETFVDKTARSAMVAHRWSSLAMTFSGTMMQTVTVAVVVVGVYEIQQGAMSVGALVACTILSGRALAPLSQIAGIATRFHQSRQALQGLDQMMKTPVERPEGRSFVTRPSVHGNIEFKNVAFSYPDAKTQALNDVSFRIEAGEKVGVIGRIGSGKSTIERLILGLYDPDEGGVLIDGTDTRQLDPADLRRAIGVVPQDVYLFWGTVRENIALGAPYADDGTILRAARIAGVDEFISKHPLGLDMPVGERGAQLSGGQRQAISIARALLLDPPILVLDEPTSAMDNTTEARFKARLGTVLANKTLILVTHRGSLLTLVDRLIVMDGGRIVADGPKDIVMEALNAGRIQTART